MIDSSLQSNYSLMYLLTGDCKLATKVFKLYVFDVADHEWKDCSSQQSQLSTIVRQMAHAYVTGFEKTWLPHTI